MASAWRWSGWTSRYADTHGFNNDASRSMWRWRDWVIDAFNANMPYDRFLTAQLSGDLLPKPTLDQRIATGYGRNHVINSEGGIIDEEYRVEYVADRVRTLYELVEEGVSVAQNASRQVDESGVCRFIRA